MTEDGGEQAYRFGDFVLDTAAARLTKGAADLKLRPKVFDFLRLLVEGRGRLFSKDELAAALWRDGVASDDSLAQLASSLRAALGDEAASIVVTVPKRGYRLGLPVAAPGAGGAARSPVRYAMSGEAAIAWQTVGAGPLDLVYVPGWVSHLDYGWEQPLLSRFYEGLASFSRLILFDKRGTGLSDRSFGLPTTEQRMDDVRAVMEAAGSERAAILAMSEGGGMAIAFAARYPERVRALALFGVFAKREWAPDYPWAPTPEERQSFYDEIEHGWGGPVGIDEIAPGRRDDADFRAWWGAYQRRSASPAAALALARMNTKVDVRALLPAVKAPTLVMHRIDDLAASVGEARFIAARIPGAELCEMPGDDHLIFAGDQNAAIAATRGFVTRF